MEPFNNDKANDESNKTATDNDVQDTVIDFPEGDSVEEQAAKWVSRLEADPLADATAAEFKQWLRQAPEHRAAFERHKALWDDMNVLTRMTPPARTQARQVTRSGATLWWRRGLAACAVAVLAVALTFVMDPTARYSTEVGEQKTVLLDDGTSVLMNTNTEIHVDYSRAERTVYLDRGEAYFTVAHEPGRPFEVHAGQGKVRAVGTAFTVYLKSDDVEVVVTEGTVEILPTPVTRPADGKTDNGDRGKNREHTRTAANRQPPARVSAGNIATYDRYTAEHVQLQVLAQADDRLSWQEGMLVFRSEPLEHVIAEVNRYTTIRIVIPEQSVRELKISGFFKVADIKSVFEALETGFNIHAKFVSEDLVSLVYRED